MGRPIKFDREEAVNWVMNEIWRAGFTGLSVKAISEKLEITRSSFYNSFKSREALFLEALELYSKESPHDKLANFSEAHSPLNHLTSIFKETCHARAEDPEHRGCMAINSVTELVGVNDALGPILEKAVGYSISCFEDLLVESVRRRELPKNTNTHDLALAVQNTLVGLNTMSKIIHSEHELWSATKTTLKALGVYNETKY
jgi:TetR/AcrR family transcriptional repressor of nem operon